MLQPLVVVETWEGLCVVGFGTCAVCGWTGWDAFDIGLEPIGDGAYRFDEYPEAVCPSCGVRECAVDLRAERPVDCKRCR